MKKLMKFTAAAIIAGALFNTNGLKAQTVPAKAFGLSLGIETGLPTTQQSNYTAFILGGTARLQYGISDKLTATFTTGGYHFFSKVIPGTSVRYSSFGVGPVKAGLKYLYTSSLYIGAEAGFGREVTEQGFVGGQTKLLLSPALGYANKHWDAALHYESLTGDQNNYGIFALRIAYGFGL